MFGEACPALRTVEYWFRPFRNGGPDVDNAPRSGRPKEMGTELIRRKAEANPTVMSRALAEDIGYCYTIIENELCALGTKKKLDRAVPHERSHANFWPHSSRKAIKKIVGA